MENVKELAIESPSGSGRAPVMEASGVTSCPSLSGDGAGFSLMAPPVQQPAPSRPWLKWAAAFFALLLAGGVAIEQQQRREREAQDLAQQRGENCGSNKASSKHSSASCSGNGSSGSA
jgi:hypothetical protein